MPAAPTPRRVGRPRSDDVVGIRENIVAAARTLFVEHGIVAVGMEAVAKAAGVTKQTLYARFPNKNELCRAVMEHVMQQWREQQGPLLGNFGSLEETLYQHSVRTLETATSEGSALLAQFLDKKSGFQPDLASGVLGTIREKGILDILTILDAFPLPDAGAASGRCAAEFYFMVLVGKINDLHAIPGPIDMQNLAAWARTAVRLFLGGYVGRS